MCFECYSWMTGTMVSCGGLCHLKSGADFDIKRPTNREKSLQKSSLAHSPSSGPDHRAEDEIGVHDNISRIHSRIRISAVEISKVANLVLFIEIQLGRDILHPGSNVLSVTPSVASVQPCAVFVRLGALRHLVRTSGRCSGGVEDP